MLDCIHNITQNRLTACSLLNKHHSGRLHCLDTFIGFFFVYIMVMNIDEHHFLNDNTFL